MLKNELMQKSGLNRDTVRHYTKIGLLKPIRLANGYLDYPTSSLSRIELIKHAKAIGMTLNQVVELLDPWEKGVISDDQKVLIFQEQLTEVDAKIASLQQAKCYLKQKLAHLKQTMEEQVA